MKYALSRQEGRLNPVPVRVAFTVVTIILFLLIGAFVWFMVTQILMVIQASCRTVIVSVGGADPFFVQADQFVTVLIMGFLAIAIFALSILVYQYSQAKSLMSGGG